MDDYGRFQPQTRQRINQLQGHLQTLSPACQNRIQDALHVMLFAHQGQDGRRPGEDYALHPLEVALHVIEEFGAKTPEVIMAALLHDTVEDQADRLASLNQPAAFATAASAAAAPRAQALHTLTTRFGPRVAELVGILTNPDFSVQLGAYQESERAAAKNALYRQHVRAITEKDPEAFLIKMADFAQNALRLHEIPEGPQKAHFRRKYGPVILQLQGQLQSLVDPVHPLFSQRTLLIQQLTAVYQRDYAPYAAG